MERKKNADAPGFDLGTLGAGRTNASTMLRRQLVNCLENLYIYTAAVLYYIYYVTEGDLFSVYFSSIELISEHENQRLQL